MGYFFQTVHEYHGHCTLNPHQVVLKNGFNRVFVRPNNTLEATAVKIYLDQDFYSHAEGCAVAMKTGFVSVQDMRK